METLKIYKSSAGSGKTYTLVLEYLKLVLLHPEEYKSILAITFTNKSAEEMKNRIIEALVSLSNDEESSIRTILSEELPKIDITKKAGKALQNILHDYTSFSVCTIDSFFQRILRALAREIHLPLNLQVEVELDDAILDSTDRLLKEVGVDKELTEWMTQLALQKMDDDKGWNLEKDIETVAKELFKEERNNAKILTREEIHNNYKKLKSTKISFEKKMNEFGENMLLQIQNHGLSVADFSYGSKGVAGYFEKICSSSNPDNYKPKVRVLEALVDPEKWTTKKSNARNNILGIAEHKLIPQLKLILSFVDLEYKNYMTGIEILKKIFLFGIVNDLQKKITEYRNENNVILLSDTTQLLSNVIHESDAPFLYEKTGNRYKHLLIDEFQDTSILQWKNLLPLIVNALGSGFMTLVVGDAKQSIYRWRGGNMNLLLSDLFSDLKQFKSMMKEEVLSVNYRSKKNIVEFNNNFFKNAPILANEGVGMNNFIPLSLAYGNDLMQNTFHKNDSGGYVKIQFLKNNLNEEETETGWKKNAFAEMLHSIKDLLNKGYQYKDICILVRKNNDGNDIANRLFQNGIEEVISPDSLLIKTSPRISFIINIFRFLSDNRNTIARSEIIYYYRRYILKNIDDNWHQLFEDHKKSGIKKKTQTTRLKTKPQPLFEGLEENAFNQYLPESFTSHLSSLGKLPIYELGEQIIRIFKLNAVQDSYIQRLLDLILEYTTKSNSSLEGFLNFWDTSRKAINCSVIVPGNTNALKIMTIHSAKGLQFPVVMIPYTEWPLLPKSNEIKWMDTVNTPYEDLGKTAVLTSARLRETYFCEEYINEINQTVIDNLNLLYVAFTRAEDKLFVSCLEDNEKDLNSISKLIFRTCKLINPEFNNGVFENGTNENRTQDSSKKISKIKTEQLSYYPTSSWQEKMSLTTHSVNLLALLNEKQMSKINYGILVHAVLAGINEKSEIDSTIDKIIFDGLINQEEKHFLKKEIAEIMAVPEIQAFYDESYEVLSERELILTDGEVLRPDRVIIKDNIATIIDFKTGKREKKHLEQVIRYADILKTMNYNSVNAKIIYLSERLVINVT